MGFSNRAIIDFSVRVVLYGFYLAAAGCIAVNGFIIFAFGGAAFLFAYVVCLICVFGVPARLFHRFHPKESNSHPTAMKQNQDLGT